MTIPDAVVGMIASAVGATVYDGEEFAPDALMLFDGVVPATPPERYVVVYIDRGTSRALAACGRSDVVTVRWTLHSIAPDRGMAHWLADRIVNGTVDQKPQVEGWSCGQIQHTFSEPPNRDEAVMERAVVYQVDLFSLVASRT